MKALPTAFVSRMKTLLGSDYPLYERAMTEQPSRALRVNTEKISLADFEKAADFPIEKIPYVENGYFFECDKIGNHPFHHAGMIYIQEPAAMMPAECLRIEKDWRILDMCAAPGGKSTQLQNKLGESGVIVSCEIVPSRCKILASNVERLGVRNSVTLCASPDKLADELPVKFDMIMVDAPCSGEGMFRKEEIAIDEWSEDNVTMCAERQAGILDCAARLVKGGGYIVYSTCTFSLEENEMTVDSFLQRHPEFEILPVSEAVRKFSADGISFEGCRCDKLSYARRFYPHLGRGEGQFMALLHSTAELVEDKPAEASRPQRDKKGKGAPKEVKPDLSEVIKLLDKTLVSYDKSAVTEYNGTPVYMPNMIDLGQIRAFTYGCAIGEVKKGYVLPYHSFFMAYGKDFKNKIELAPDSEEIIKYLRGEELETDAPDGWAAVTVCGCAIGGVKVVSGVAKNHYPKGLRLKS